MYKRVRAAIVDLSKEMVRNRKVSKYTNGLWGSDAASCY